ncbi:MAG TPA: hypothetical protein GX700_04545 [Paracoccus sp.]|nr:hypothetical protein [Paracoccus sp. (in: a-proteobacteria)]
MPHALTSRPWHLLPVALLLVLWHGALAFDYLNLRFALFPGIPPLFPALPLEAMWMKVVWAMAVWLGLLGAVFLLLSDDASVLLLFAAAASMLAALAGVMTGAAPVAVTGVLAAVGWPGLAVALALVPLAGWLYARDQKRRDVLH